MQDNNNINSETLQQMNLRYIFGIAKWEKDERLSEMEREYMANKADIDQKEGRNQ